MGFGIYLPIRKNLAFKHKVLIFPSDGCSDGIFILIQDVHIRGSLTGCVCFGGLKFFFFNGKLGYSAEKFNRGQCLQVQVLFQVYLQHHAAKELCGKFCLRISGVYGISQLSHSVVLRLLLPLPIVTYPCMFINHSLGRHMYRSESRNVVPMGNIKTSLIWSI